jgi:hypothetical protein
MLMNKVPYIKVIVELMLLNLGQQTLKLVFVLVFLSFGI